MTPKIKILCGMTGFLLPNPDPVLADLQRLWPAALGDHLVGLYVHGSLMAGDFDPERSDLDVFAVLDREPDLSVLAPLHEELAGRHPEWAGRIEVEYLASPVEGAVMARISPGEALHLLPVTRHRVVTWAAVRDYGRALAGPPAAEVLPQVSAEAVEEALRDHVRDWPHWVVQMRPPGAQAYAVLTICRALQRLAYGQQLSKRRAATATVSVRPDRAALIRWATRWWYEGGLDTDPGHYDDVCRFVAEVSAEILTPGRGGGA